MSPAKPQQSMNPETWDSGRPDDLTALITKARFIPFKYANSKSYFLALRVDFEPDEESGYKPFSEHYRAGWLNRTMPSNDGSEPAGASASDYDLLSKNEADVEKGDEERYEGITTVGPLQKNNDAHQFLTALAACGFDGWGMTIDCIEGARVHLNRLAADNKAKNVDPTKGEWKILVPTALVEVVKASGAKAAKASKANGAETAATTTGDDPFDTDFDAWVLEQIAGEDSTSLSRSDLAKRVPKRFKGGDMAKALQRINNPKLLGADSRPWGYDAASGTLSIG